MSMMNKIKRIIILSIGLVCLIWMVIYFGNDVLILFESDDPSVSIGNVADGKLINGKRLPSSGDNFTSFSRLAYLIGRNGVHHKVRDVILDSYGQVYINYPEYRYMLGETSWLSGGSIKPHRTHQNGVSVDFMVPVKSDEGNIEIIPAHLFNKFGYNIEFDSTGRSEDLQIDYKSMSTHLYYLYQSAEKQNLRISLVIFDPNLQTFLFDTPYGQKIKNLIRFYDQPVWIRHDEHYHVNFEIIK